MLSVENITNLHSIHFRGGGGGGGVSRPSMSAYVLSFLDSMRQRTCFFGTLADIEGHWRTRMDIGGLRRTLADSDGLVLQRGGLHFEIA